MYRVIQVIGPADYLVSIFGRPVWIHGESTAGKTDDTFIELPGTYRITSTKQYATAGNATRTVFVFEPDRTPVVPATSTAPS